MIVLVDWNTFKFSLGNGLVWIKEDDVSWSFYSSVNENFVIKCVVNKSEFVEDNIIFVEREIKNRPNFFKCIDVFDTDSLSLVEDDVEEDDFEEENEFEEEIEIK